MYFYLCSAFVCLPQTCVFKHRLYTEEKKLADEFVFTLVGSLLQRFLIQGHVVRAPLKKLFLSILATVDVVVTLRPLELHNRTGGKI